MNIQLAPASADRMQDFFEKLATFNATPGEGITRVALTAEDFQARDYVKQRMEELNLIVSQDGAGNIFGRLPGTDPSLPAVWSGSHIDSVLHGGRYDGTAGVVGALEAVKLIQDAGIKCKRDIVVVVFTAEEPTKFGLGCVGSRVMVEKLRWDDAQNVKDEEGRSLPALTGSDRATFEKSVVARGSVHSFVELHIEQAEQLEQKGIPIGVIHTISAPTEIHMTATGKQRHAGATPMDLRCDPFSAVAEIALCLEKTAREQPDPSTVATIGKVNLNPNASNVIPRSVEFSIDIRSSVVSDKTAILASLDETTARLERERGVSFTKEILCDDVPTKASPDIMAAIKDSCQALGYPYLEMASGAYHDAMFMAEIAPFGMIFVPSKDGISHDREEWTSPDELAKGADVLANTLLQLSYS